MTQNAQDVWKDIVWIVASASLLIIFAVGVAWPHRSRVRPGSRGHRPESDEGEHEVVRPDGYIDSFAKEASEAGGGLPPLIQLALPGILLWWLLYLILNWHS